MRASESFIESFSAAVLAWPPPLPGEVGREVGDEGVRSRPAVSSSTIACMPADG
jgi:hypothetical protein